MTYRLDFETLTKFMKDACCQRCSFQDAQIIADVFNRI